MSDVVVVFNDESLPASMTNVIAGAATVGGATAAVWWQRQASQLQHSFMDQVRLSLENGESTREATTRIVGGVIDGVAVTGIMNTARHKAEALVRTAISDIVNKVRLSTFQNMDDVIKAVQQISTLDGKTSDICIAYSGLVWDIVDLLPIGHSLPFNGGPPRHFNCRSSLVPVLRSFEELGIDATEVPLATRASMDGEVPGDITFDAWLKSKSKTFQDDLLGPGRSRLWRNGKISLTQLVDMRGRPMTLEQLENL